MGTEIDPLFKFKPEGAGLTPKEKLFVGAFIAASTLAMLALQSKEDWQICTGPLVVTWGVTTYCLAGIKTRAEGSIVGDLRCDLQAKGDQFRRLLHR